MASPRLLDLFASPGALQENRGFNKDLLQSHHYLGAEEGWRCLARPILAPRVSLLNPRCSYSAPGDANKSRRRGDATGVVRSVYYYSPNIPEAFSTVHVNARRPRVAPDFFGLFFAPRMCFGACEHQHRDSGPRGADYAELLKTCQIRFSS